MDKLKEKRQVVNLSKQARHAVSLFVEMNHCSVEKDRNDIPPVNKTEHGQVSTGATHLHTKKSLSDQAVSLGQAVGDSKAAVSNTAKSVPSTSYELNCSGNQRSTRRAGSNINALKIDVFCPVSFFWGLK